jgi:hypothetical protein
MPLLDLHLHELALDLLDLRQPGILLGSSNLLMPLGGRTPVLVRGGVLEERGRQIVLDGWIDIVIFLYLSPFPALSTSRYNINTNLLPTAVGGLNA